MSQDALIQADTYAEAATGSAKSLQYDSAEAFALQVKGVGASATAWNVVLEVSLDGTHYATLLTHSSADGDSDGGIVWTGANASPALYFRTRCVSVTLGSATALSVTAVGR